MEFKIIHISSIIEHRRNDGFGNRLSVNYNINLSQKELCIVWNQILFMLKIQNYNYSSYCIINYV